MKSYSVYLSYLTCRNNRYRLSSISYKDIIANDIIHASNLAIQKAKKAIHNNVTPIEVSMIWYN